MHTHDENGDVVSEPYFPPSPIFWSLVTEFRKDGHDLPWFQTFKPSGTVGILGDMSYGIHAYYGMMVRNPSDYIRLVNINPA